MRSVGLMFFLLIISGINFLSCGQSDLTVEVNRSPPQSSPNNTPENLPDVNMILQKLENRYYAFTFYKAKAENIYSRKGFSEETSIKREIGIEYSSPSQIRAEMRDGKDTKILISKDNITTLWVDGKEKKNYEDVYWGLTSAEFGDGVFFEIGRLLVTKEYGKGEIISIRNLVNPEIIGEEVIDERVCYKIQGTFKTDDLAKVTYWIDKESFLIRQYERLLSAKKIPNGYYKTVETYTDIEAK
jgi:hypothetical protein